MVASNHVPRNGLQRWLRVHAFERLFESRIVDAGDAFLIKMISQ
jgi:hypothetical protein